MRNLLEQVIKAFCPYKIENTLWILVTFNFKKVDWDINHIYPADLIYCYNLLCLTNWLIIYFLLQQSNLFINTYVFLLLDYLSKRWIHCETRNSWRHFLYHQWRTSPNYKTSWRYSCNNLTKTWIQSSRQN